MPHANTGSASTVDHEERGNTRTEHVISTQAPSSSAPGSELDAPSALNSTRSALPSTITEAASLLTTDRAAAEASTRPRPPAPPTSSAAPVLLIAPSQSDIPVAQAQSTPSAVNMDEEEDTMMPRQLMSTSTRAAPSLQISLTGGGGKVSWGTRLQLAVRSTALVRQNLDQFDIPTTSKGIRAVYLFAPPQI